jgi:hypothetical protein
VSWSDRARRTAAPGTPQRPVTRRRAPRSTN